MYSVTQLDHLVTDQQYQFQNSYNVELDDYIYCELCDEDVYEYCTTHGPLIDVPDETPSEEELNSSGLPWSALTLPRDVLYIAPSTMPGGALGVFAAMTIPARVSFGPYCGLVRAPGGSTAQPYAWAILDSTQRPVCEVDASDPHRSNWLRYVNCARHQRHQNLIAYQFQRNIYYRTIKPVPKNTELLVYLGSDVAYWMGVHVGSYAYMGTVSNLNRSEPRTTDINKNDYKNNTTIEAAAVNGKTIENNLQEERNKKPEENNSNDDKATKCIKSHKTVKARSSIYSLKNITKTKDTIRSTDKEGKELRGHQTDDNQRQYSTAQKNDVETHMHTLTDKRPLKCDLCEYRATEKMNLQRHIRTHTGERPFKCDLCEYRATKKMNLQRHIRTHTGERPFKCDLCEYRATQKNNLQIHIRTHTGERPFKCDQCEYRAIHKSHLHRHIRTHTGAKPI